MKKVVGTGLAAVIVAFAWWWTTEPAPARQLPAAVVNVIQPVEVRVDEDLESVGTASAPRGVNISSRIDGRLLATGFSEGQTVQKGDLLATLDGRAAAAELAAAEAGLANARLARERAHRLQQDALLSRAEYDALEAAHKAAQAQVDAARVRFSDHSIHAPFAGVVGLRRVNAGSFIKAGDVITTLDDLAQLEVLFHLPERYLARLAIGQEVIVTSEAWPDSEFRGLITQLDSRVDLASRTVAVKAALANDDRALLPGQYLGVRVLTGSRRGLMVPEQAVLTEGPESFAWIVSPEGLARRRELELGARRDGWVEVRHGIAATEQVVINGNARLRDGAPLEIREDREALLPGTRQALAEPATAP